MSLILRAHRLAALLEEADQKNLPDPAVAGMSANRIHIRLRDEADFTAWAVWLGAGMVSFPAMGQATELRGTSRRYSEEIALAATGNAVQVAS